METIQEKLELAKLAGLVDMFREPDVRQSEQERLLQALRKLRRQSTRGHQGLTTSEERPRAGCEPVMIIRNSVRWRLRTLELPGLLGQLARLAEAINPAGVADQPQGQFRTAVRLLTEMESSVDRIASSAGAATRDAPCGGASGEEAEEMTLHRSVQVVSRCKSVLIQLARMLGGYERFFRVLVLGQDGRLSTGSQPVDYLQEFRKESVPRVASEVMQWIRHTLLPWLALSNMRFLHHEWLSLKTAADELQAELAARPINNTLQTPTPLHPPSNKEAASLRNQLIIALIPLSKLARLFLNKLCQSCSPNGPLLLHHMPVQHQEELRVATKSVSSALHDIFNTRDSPQPHLLSLSRDLIGTLRNSTTTIQSIFLQHYQSLPSSSSSSNHHHDPQRWFQLWLQQFSLATNNFLRTLERHADDENSLDNYHA